MAMFVFCWIGFSVLFCLALLRGAARPRPDVEMMSHLAELARVQSETAPATENRQQRSSKPASSVEESCVIR